MSILPYAYYTASCFDGQLRLINGSTEYEGRVEICSSQRWETLNYNRWTSNTARVACIELGYASMYTNVTKHLRHAPIKFKYIIYMTIV